jgi:lysophospholipase L1-like esterase
MPVILRCFSLILLLALLLQMGCEKTPALRPLAADAVVLAFGDSLTYGTGAPAGASYPDVLAATLGHKVVNAGIPGEISETGLARLPEVLDAVQPQLVILCHGGNDFLQQRSSQQVAANLRAMVDLCRAAGAEVILIAVPQFGLMAKTHPLYAEVAQEKGVPCANEILHDLLTDPALKSDPIHPNAAGYRQLAQAVAQLYMQASGDRR